MDERKRMVLDAVIRDYIATAEPVGSRSVAKKYGLGVSPATIRNEMSDLEELGYIEQPHTSAGRRPSHKGYRYYVDYLMKKEELSESERSFIKRILFSQLNETEMLMRNACRLLAKLTNYPAVIVMPKVDKGCLEKIQFVPINPSQILVVAVTDTGVVSHRLMTLRTGIDPLTLAILEKHFQSKLGGLRMAQVTRSLLRELTENMSEYGEIGNAVMELMEQSLLADAEEKVFTGGIFNILSQPEFREPEMLKSVMALLEQETGILGLLKPLNEGDGLTVTIGMEIPYEAITNCSMVLASYKQKNAMRDASGDKSNGSMGVIGVIGPTRMSYSKTVSLVDFIANELSEVYSYLRF